MSKSVVPEDNPSRSKIIRDVLIFQAKLWLEGFKDLALMPLSFGAAVVDVIFGGSTLYSVMKLGDRFERWVHLYGALGEEAESDGPDGRLRSLDHLLNEAAEGIEERTLSRSESGDSRPSL